MQCNANAVVKRVRAGKTIMPCYSILLVKQEAPMHDSNITGGKSKIWISGIIFGGGSKGSANNTSGDDISVCTLYDGQGLLGVFSINFGLYGLHRRHRALSVAAIIIPVLSLVLSHYMYRHCRQQHH